MATTRSEKIHRKKLKREKIRRKHLEATKLERLHATRHELDEMLSGCTYKFPKEFIPASDDMDNWGRINWFRTPAKVLAKAKEVFADNDALKAYYDNKIGFNRDKFYELGWVFTAASQLVCFDPPFFFPFFSFKTFSPSVGFFWARAIKDKKDLWRIIGMDKHVKLDNVEHPVYLSTHSLWRFWARGAVADIATNMLYRTQFYYQMMRHFTFEDSGRPNMLAVVNTNERLKQTLGLHQPFGYCPVAKYDNHIVAKTFLLPGYENTPESEWFSDKSRAKNISDVSAQKQKFEDNGVISFLGETSEESRSVKNVFKNYVIESTWKKCGHLYRRVEEPVLV